MKNYFNFLILKASIYYLLVEIKKIFRYFKYLFNLTKSINIFKYLIYKKKDYLILRDNNQKKALKKNYYFWKKIIKENKEKENILVTNLVSTKEYTMHECTIGLMLSNILKKNPVGLIKSHDFMSEIFMRSFGIDKIYSIPEGNIYSNLKFFFKSISLMCKIKKTDDLLNLKYEEIDVGKIIYNHAIRFSGIGSIKFVTPKMFYYLSQTLLVLDHSKYIFKNNSFKEVIQTENQFIPANIVFEEAIINNCNVFARIGLSNKISVRFYKNIKNKYVNRYRFSGELFNSTYKNHKIKILDKTKEIMKRRFLGNLAYQVDHGLEEGMDHKFKIQTDLIKDYTKNDLCKKYNWSPEKPIVIIFSIDLTDGIFTDRWRMYKDNLTWIQQTLKIIKNIDHINWLIKSHPNDVKLNVFTTTEKEVSEISKTAKNINLFPRNFGNNPLPKIISAAVTANGSAGFEYPSLGVPTITCGDSFYAGRGFNHEPSSEAEYIKLLKNVDTLPPLSDEEINKAKTFIYIYSVLTKVNTSLGEGLQKIENIKDIDFWKNLETRLENYELEKDTFYKNFKIQLEKSDRHTINYDLLKN